MAIQRVNRLPFINRYAYITSIFWEETSTGNHRGVDIAVPRANVPLYSMVNGRVIHVGYDANGFGNYIIIKERTTNLGFLYAHLDSISVHIGEEITYKQVVGIEGQTGYATGIHLHLEMQDLTNHQWIYHGNREDYINPATWIPYTEIIGDQLYWETSEPPTPPTPGGALKSKFKWVLYARKLRNKKGKIY